VKVEDHDVPSWDAILLLLAAMAIAILVVAVVLSARALEAKVKEHLEGPGEASGDPYAQLADLLAERSFDEKAPRRRG